MTGVPLTWSSSNPAVLSVSPEGLVKGAGGGSAKITAKTSNGVWASAGYTARAYDSNGNQLSGVAFTRSGPGSRLPGLRLFWLCRTRRARPYLLGFNIRIRAYALGPARHAARRRAPV
jgi:hypothetical protein